MHLSPTEQAHKTPQAQQNGVYTNLLCMQGHARWLGGPTDRTPQAQQNRADGAWGTLSFSSETRTVLPRPPARLACDGRNPAFPGPRNHLFLWRGYALRWLSAAPEAALGCWSTPLPPACMRCHGGEGERAQGRGGAPVPMNCGAIADFVAFVCACVWVAGRGPRCFPGGRKWPAGAGHSLRAANRAPLRGLRPKSPRRRKAMD